MDPYLEARWSDVRVTLIAYIGESLQLSLPDALRARAQERLLTDEETRESDLLVDRFIQIIDVTNGNRVVTAIEILSPWNKSPGRLNKDYLRKLDDYARGGVSVVEMDLLRYPPRGRLHVTEADIAPQRRAPYYVCVRYAWIADEWYAYPMTLRQALPRVPIPLRRTDALIGLELQPLIEHVYSAGAHDDIDYTRPADPPLEGEDAAWAEQLLRAAGKR
jgi:hypothetical protein